MSAKLREDDGMLAPAEVAARLGMDNNQLLRLLNTGMLAGAYKLGGRWRIPPQAVDSYLELEARGCRGTTHLGRACGNRPQPSGFCGRCSAARTHADPGDRPDPSADDDADDDDSFHNALWALAQSMYDKSYVDGEGGGRVATQGSAGSGADARSGEAGGVPRVFDVTGTSGYAQWLAAELGDDWLADNEDSVGHGTELVGASKQDSTVETYNNALKPFHRWCGERGLSPLPAKPQTVGVYLTWLSVRGKLNSKGEQTGERLSTAWLRTTLMAIRAEHLAAGLASPTSDPTVMRLVEGYARKFGKPPTPAYALRIEDLGLLATDLSRPTPTHVRDVAMLLVSTDEHARLNASQLGRLFWSGGSCPSGAALVFLDDDLSAPVTVDVGAGRQVLFAPAADPRVCPVRALHSLAFTSGRAGPVFPGRDPLKPMSRQGVQIRIDTLLAQAELPVGPVIDGMPRLDKQTQFRLVSPMQEPSDEQVRDRAILSLLWFGQLRRSELAAFDWGDSTAMPLELIVFVGRSKTDLYGAGEPRPLANQPGFIGCPVASVAAWRKRYRTLLGRDIEADDPMFQSLHRGGKLSGRMSGNAVNEMVQRRCAESNITPDPGSKISSHMGRAGGATAMLLAGKDREVVAHFSRRTAGSLGAYFRPGMRSNPTRGLAAAAGESSEQLSPTTRRSSADRDVDAPAADGGRGGS